MSKENLEDLSNEKLNKNSSKNKLKKIRSKLRKIENQIDYLIPGFKERVKIDKKHGIKLPYLTYPDITKPIWTEEVYNNDFLYRECKQDIESAQDNIKIILVCEELRKDPKLRRKIKIDTQVFATFSLLSLWKAARYLVKFENEKYLSNTTIQRHRKKSNSYVKD